jgi:DNA-binding beta-propeller fold protein YncE
MNCRAAISESFRARALWVLSFLLLPLIWGCSAPKENFTADLFELEGYSQDTPRISCFLTLKEPHGPDLRLEVASIEVLGDGLWLPLTRGPLTLDSAAIGSGQIYLGATSAPPGNYRRIRFMITRGELGAADGNYAVVTNDPFAVEVPISENMDLNGTDRRSLLISWDVESSIRNDNILTPALVVNPPTAQLLVGLVYVSCPNIDTIFIVRADKNWVVDSFGLRGGPTYLAIDPNRSRQLLYVLASRERSIKVVDLANNKVVDSFRASLSDSPTFMTISPDGQRAYLLDEEGGFLDSIDLSTGQSVARVHLDFRPSYAGYLEEMNLLAVSLSLSQEVLLLDPVTLTVKMAIPAGSNPQGLDISENFLMVAEEAESTVSMTDLENRGNQDRLSVGFSPLRILATDDQVYVSNYRSGSLSVLVPGHLTVFQEIPGLGRPKEMVFNKFYRRVYVTDEERGAFSIVDANANQLLGSVSLGARPFGLAAIE